MCGITGIIKEKDNITNINEIKKMTDILYHRGPDDDGYFVENEIALGMRRLSIIDLNFGNQPQFSMNDQFVIVYNGEIYNFNELKKDLSDKGYVFKTLSDTEVILASFSFYGTNCVKKFNGMFAFAIWDKNKKTCYLFRDRIGVKPLYYSILKDGTFIFASEIKALLQYPGFKAELNYKALNNLFTFGFQLCPHTFFKNINQVLPGHFMEISFSQINQYKYWDINFNKPKLKLKTNDIAELLNENFQKAVKKRLVSDVPVGSYLSGGIDSTSVTGYYSKLNNGNISSFSIGFPMQEYNELEFSNEAANFFNTKHTSFICNPDIHDLKSIIWHLEEPLITILNLPLFYLSKTVKNSGYKVILSGDGSDEILGGYNYFKLQKLYHFIQNGNESIKRIRLLKKILPHLKNDVDCVNYYKYLKHQYINTNTTGLNIPYLFYTIPNKHQLFSNHLNNEFNQNTDIDFFFNPNDIQNMNLMDQMFYIEIKLRLLNLTLPLSDKMSMANSVENRSPFFDYELIEFISTIPNELKINGLNEKFILKKAMKNFLPNSIIKRKKQPLQTSSKWIIETFKEQYEYYLSDQVIKDKGYFNLEYVNLIKNDLNNINSSNINLMIFFIHYWDDIFLKGI